MDTKKNQEFGLDNPKFFATRDVPHNVTIFSPTDMLVSKSNDPTNLFKNFSGGPMAGPGMSLSNLT